MINLFSTFKDYNLKSILDCFSPIVIRSWIIIRKIFLKPPCLFGHFGILGFQNKFSEFKCFK